MSSPHPSSASRNPIPETRSPSVSAFRSRDAWAWMLVACILSIAIDLWSKSWAFDNVASQPVLVIRDEVIRVKETIDPRAITPQLIPEHKPMVVVPHVLNLQLVLNPGAVFGIGPGKRLFFIGFTVIALGFGLMMFARWTGPRDHFAHAAIGLLIGGGLGNLYDRLNYACVRDFLHPLPDLKWPGGFKLMGNDEVWPYVSNLADLFLLIGIGMLLIHLWKRDRAHAAAARRQHAPASNAA